MAHAPKTRSEKAVLSARRAWCYLVLVLISFLCLFFFYILIVNSTRTHFEIQKGFSLLPGKSMLTNFKNVLADANIPVGSGIRNSLIVSACSAALSVYFSALTAYGIYAYNFRFKKAAFAIILLIMTMPTQVSALGFLQLITKMGLKNSFIPLIVPSIAAPTVFFFMKQYLDASLPMEIVEAARIDGGGEFYTFNHIVLPIMKPALAVQAIFSFVASWNNSFIPALVLDSADKKTLPILIAQLRSALECKEEKANAKEKTDPAANRGPCTAHRYSGRSGSCHGGSAVCGQRNPARVCPHGQCHAGLQEVVG